WPFNSFSSPRIRLSHKLAFLCSLLKNMISDDINKIGISVLRINNKQLQNLIEESMYMVDTKIDLYCLCLVLEGSIQFNLNQEEFELEKNSVFLASPDTPKNGNTSVNGVVDMLLV